MKKRASHVKTKPAKAMPAKKKKAASKPKFVCPDCGNPIGLGKTLGSLCDKCKKKRTEKKNKAFKETYSPKKATSVLPKIKGKTVKVKNLESNLEDLKELKEVFDESGIKIKTESKQPVTITLPQGISIIFVIDGKQVEGFHGLLERAADQEGMTCEDIVKFPDLLKKHGVPYKLSQNTIDKAHALQRELVRRTIRGTTS
jgi:hypothetical protein